jgi:putative hemolysin
MHVWQMKKSKKNWKKRREAYQQSKKIKEASKRNMTSKESIAMVNPAYIATQQEGGTSTLKCETKKSCDAGRTTNIATSSKRRVLGKTEEN